MCAWSDKLTFFFSMAFRRMKRWCHLLVFTRGALVWARLEFWGFARMRLLLDAGVCVRSVNISLLLLGRRFRCVRNIGGNIDVYAIRFGWPSKYGRLTDLLKSRY